MALKDICPVLLNGTDGQSFWPISRRNAPKQFARIGSRPSLFQNALRKFADVGLGAPVIVAPTESRYVIQDQSDEAGISPRSFVYEPAARGTLAGACAASEIVGQTDPDAMLLLLLSDRWTIPTQALIDALEAGLPWASDGQIICLGFAPQAADPHYTYIEMAQGNVESTIPQPMAQIIDNPDPQAAADMLGTSRYLWSADMVLASAKTLRGIYGRHAAATRATIRRAVREAHSEGNTIRLGDCYTAAEDARFEKAVMEHQHGFVVPVPIAAEAISDWADVWKTSEKDDHGVRIQGKASAVGCENTLLSSETSGVQVVGVGLKNIAVVATADAVLVTDLDAVDSIPIAVQQMEKQSIPQARESTTQMYPWGHVETLQTGERHRVRWVTIKPGCCIPMQSHLNRSENWVVVEGTGRITMDGETRLITEHDKVFVPTGAEHRLENPGRAPLRMIEIQTGPYLGDDDVHEVDGTYELSD